MSKRKTHKEFLKDLKNKNEFYRKGLFKIIGVYHSWNTPIEILYKYGLCLMMPSTLYKNSKPDIRSAVDKKSYFISMCREIHGDRYDYSCVEYIDWKTDVCIICPNHGKFYQRPNNHLSGKKKCPHCGYELASYKLSDWKEMCNGDTGKLYILRCHDDKESFIKIGITCQDINKRYSKSKGVRMPYSFDILRVIESEDRGYIWELEKEIIKKNKNNRYSPNKKFKGGNIECFDEKLFSI